MAKLIPLLILVGFLVVAFSFLSVSSSQYVPYDNLNNKYATYENMTEFDVEGEGEGDVVVEEEEEMPVNYSEETFNVIEEPAAKNPFASIFSGVFPNTENFESLMEEPRTISYGQLRDSEIIDKFSQVNSNGMDGVNGCVSSGLTNAGGYICLTPELIQLLKTRGGNASGK
jgi:hypothetical protein